MSNLRFVENPELVSAAFVPNEMEAEMIRGLLESAGIPSIIEAAGLAEGTRNGFNGLPVYGGAQKVLVHAHRLQDAQAVIALAQGDDDDTEPGLS